VPEVILARFLGLKVRASASHNLGPRKSASTFSRGSAPGHLRARSTADGVGAELCAPRGSSAGVSKVDGEPHVDA